MTQTTSHPIGSGRTRVVHTPTGSEIVTDVAPEFGGGGSTFSSTDLVAAALGSCISSSIAPLIERHGLSLDVVAVDVEKETSTDPKRISRLAVTIRIAAPPDRRLGMVVDRAAHTCAVHRSLHPDIDSPVAVVFAPE